MFVQDDKKTKDSESSQDSHPASLGRRALLRRGVVAMPAILTLQSGAALARSSNLIGAASPDTTDGLGRTLCLDTNSVVPAGRYGDKFDMGYNPTYAKINIITARDYRVDKNNSAATMSQGAVCEGGTPAWFNQKDGSGWQQIELPYRGVVVSSGAILSNAAYIADDLW
jgi:hypothetical protein